MIGQEFKQESFSDIFKSINGMLEQAKPTLEALKKDGTDVSTAEKAFAEILATKAEMSEKLKDIFKND